MNADDLLWQPLNGAAKRRRGRNLVQSCSFEILPNGQVKGSESVDYLE